YLEIKFGFQRMFRGYDNRMRWNYEYENAKITLEILQWLKEHKHGAPYTSDPDNILTTRDVPTTSEGVNDEWFKRWDEAIDLMIDGFKSYIECKDTYILDENGQYDHKASQAERDRLWKKWEIGSR